MVYNYYIETVVLHYYFWLVVQDHCIRVVFQATKWKQMSETCEVQHRVLEDVSYVRSRTTVAIERFRTTYRNETSTKCCVVVDLDH